MSTVTLTTGTWTLDPKRTTVAFTAKNFFVKSVPGTFDLIAGDAELGDDLTATKLRFSLDAASFTTGNDKRDEHVRSDDFLHAERYPTIDFTSHRITQKAPTDAFEVAGKLAIAGISADIVFHVDSLEVRDDTSASFLASAELDRRVLGVTKMPALMIGNTIAVSVSGVATHS